MALNLSNLTEYVNQHALEIIAKVVAEPTTVKHARIQEGVKNQTAINLLYNSAPTQLGANCVFSATGSQTPTQRIIDVCPLRYNDLICLNDLNAYYFNELLKSGSPTEELPFETVFVNKVIADKAKDNETLIWQGGTGGLSSCNGLLDILLTASASVVRAGGTASPTLSNIRTIVDELYLALPEDIQMRDDLVMFMSPANFNLYRQALINANIFNLNAYLGAGKWEVPMFGHENVTVVATTGLTGQNDIVLTYEENIYIGVDTVEDSKRVKMIYNEWGPYAYNLQVMMDWKLGVQIAFPEFVVWYRTN